MVVLTLGDVIADARVTREGELTRERPARDGLGLLVCARLRLCWSSSASALEACRQQSTSQWSHLDLASATTLGDDLRRGDLEGDGTGPVGPTGAGARLNADDHRRRQAARAGASTAPWRLPASERCSPIRGNERSAGRRPARIDSETPAPQVAPRRPSISAATNSRRLIPRSCAVERLIRSSRPDRASARRAGERAGHRACTAGSLSGFDTRWLCPATERHVESRKTWPVLWKPDPARASALR